MTPLISLTGIEKSFGHRVLFSELSLVVAEGERTIIIGPNGAGKSTLFRIIVGDDLPDNGSVSRSKGLRVALVGQSDIDYTTGTIAEHLYEALDEKDHDAARRVHRCLATLGFDDGDVAVQELSGGWRKRLSIGKALIKEPDLLLLDEPTNHLDIDSIVWLESVVSSFRGAIVSISHDRYFIERSATRVLELQQGYPKGYLAVDGAYSDFIEAKENFWSQREQQRASLANKVRREVEWLRQGVKARTTKSQARIKSAHALQHELAEMRESGDRASLEVVGGDRRSKEYAVLKEVTFSYPDKQPIVRDFTFTVGPGVRIGITGPNGTGKSTLVKLLVGELSPQKGTIKALHNLKVAYLDQARERVDDSLRLKEILCPEGDSVVVGGRQHHVIAWAKRFLFTPEQLDRPFSFLSGGEKARALLAVLVSQSVDVLVLDEPTNDLDIPTREILEQALMDFAGAVILVSHDRFMLDAVCTHVVGFDGVSSPTVCADYGQWEELRTKIKIAAKDKGETADKRKEPSQISQSNGEGDRKAATVKLTYAERIELSKMEDAILSAEATLEQLQQELGAGSNDPAWFATHGAKIAEAETTVKRLYDRWEMLEGKRKG